MKNIDAASASWRCFLGGSFLLKKNKNTKKDDSWIRIKNAASMFRTKNSKAWILRCTSNTEGDINCPSLKIDECILIFCQPFQTQNHPNCKKQSSHSIQLYLETLNLDLQHGSAKHYIFPLEQNPSKIMKFITLTALNGDKTSWLAAIEGKERHQKININQVARIEIWCTLKTEIKSVQILVGNLSSSIRTCWRNNFEKIHLTRVDAVNAVANQLPVDQPLTWVPKHPDCLVVFTQGWIRIHTLGFGPYLPGCPASCHGWFTTSTILGPPNASMALL